MKGHSGTDGLTDDLKRAHVLTPSTPAVPNYCCSKGSAPYWSNPPFKIFDIRARWRSVLSARVPECQKLKNGGLDQYSKVYSLNGIGGERVKIDFIVCQLFTVLAYLGLTTLVRSKRDKWYELPRNGPD